MMATYSEPVRSYEAILSDQGNISYENVTIGVAADLTAGTVLGKKKFVQAAAPIPTVVGTGNGTMTLLRFGPDVQVGSYVITCTAAVTHGGVFSIVAPDGTALPTLTLTPGSSGTTAYASTHLSFSITEGTDFVVGDKFTVVVTAAGTPVVVASASANGTIGSITLGKYAQLGTYKIVNQLAGTHLGTFHVYAPDGSNVGHGIIAGGAGGTQVFTSDHVNFTITDGSTDFALADYFNIIVANQSAVTGYYYSYDPTAVDGTQEPCAVLVEAAAAASTAAAANALVRLGEVKSADLTWKANVTAAQKAAAAKQLLANSMIVVRS
jgi:hypothetical protein